MKSNIRDVAKLANVSISTVSRVLNNPKMVSTEKKEKVLQAIKELKFTPNALARGLIYRRTQTIGVLIPDVSNFFSAEVLRGMEDAARESNNTLIICNTDLNKDRMFSYLETLNEKQVDGIVFTSEPVYPDYYDIFEKLNIPVVLAATHSLEYDIPSVKINDEQAAFDATEYLVKKGHQNIGMISGFATDPIAGLPRLQGFMRAMRTYEIDIDVHSQVEYGDYRYGGGYQAMQKLFEKRSDLTAIFAASDEMALGAISFLHYKGLQVPEDVSVIGYDNTRISSMCIPKLTAVAQPLYKMGFDAVKKLEELLANGEVHELRSYLPHEIIERESAKEFNRDQQIQVL